MIYPNDYINKIICANCLDIMQGIPDNSIDLVLTSPPYNKNGFRGGKIEQTKGCWIGSKIEYDNYEDNMPEEDYKNWQISILDECYRIIKSTGSIFYNHKIRRSNHKASHPFEWVMKSKCNFYQQITWDRCG